MGTEIQDFAAELRGLKERSGLSYGTLAQKLHMSTSTVHRYCNGDAVPHDYAPVERFARVCRASADEMVGLHRKWILADEAKRRGTRKAGAGAAAPVEAVEPQAVTPQPVAEPVPVPVPVPEPAPTAEDVTPDAGDAGEGGGTGAAPVRGRLSSGRLRVLLAATAVVALTVPTALVVNSRSDDRTDDGGRAHAASSSSQDASGRTGSASPVPSSPPTPSPSASSVLTTPSATAGKPTASGAPDGRDEGAGSRGAPVSATVSSYNWESPCGQHYLLDREPGDVVPPPTHPRDRRDWSRTLGGVEGGDMKLALTLQGESQEAVVLQGLHVRVLARNAALDWPAYSMGDGCGGGITPQTFDVDLDDSRPRSKPVAGEDAGRVVPAKDFPYRVSSTDVEVFHIDAHVEGHDVSWYLELEWSSGGRSGTLRIDDNGEPFRASSLTGRPEYIYDHHTAEWVDRDAVREDAGH